MTTPPPGSSTIPAENPEAPEALKARALQFRAQGQWDEAGEAFEQWAASVPDNMRPFANVENYANRSDLARCEGNIPQALQLCATGRSMVEALARHYPQVDIAGAPVLSGSPDDGHCSVFWWDSFVVSETKEYF